MRDEYEGIVFCVVYAAVIWICAHFAGSCIATNTERSKAVAAGVAEWTYTTNSLGQLRQSGFRYKTNSLAK